MLPYIILIAVPAVFGMASRRIKIKNDKGNLVITAFFFILMFLITVRSINIGSDTHNYVNYYNYLGEMQWEGAFDSDLEPAFVVLSKLIYGTGVSHHVYFGIVAVLSLAPVWYFYRSDNESTFLTVTLFLCIAPFHMYFSGIRQTLAMAFAIPAYYFSMKKKPILFIVFVFIAFMFHRSAFVLLLMYPLCRMRITAKWLWIVVPVIGILFLFNEPMFLFLSGFINDFFLVELEATGAYMVLILLIVFTVYCYLLPDQALMDDKTIALRNFLLLCVCFQCFAPINALAMRMNYYFLPFIPMLITRVANRAKKKNQTIAELSVLVMTVFFTVYFLYTISRGGGLHIYPYVPYWSA